MSPKSKIEKLRRKIDRLDLDLLRTLASRMEISEEIGRGRRGIGVAPLQTGRWREIMASRTAQGGKMGLPARFISKLFELVHKESIRRQARIIRSK